VIRAGLTPKFKDVEVLCATLTYDDGPPHLVRPREIATGVRRYKCPVPEFLVDKVELEPGSVTVLPASPAASILVVLGGSGKYEEMPDVPHSQAELVDSGLVHEVGMGATFMLCAGARVRIVADDGLPSPLLLFRATTKYDLEDEEDTLDARIAETSLREG